MLHRLMTLILLVVFLTLAVGPSLAKESQERPRIGLCLAGGGARGGAQIGVLKVLEEMRVPIDCIAGTSIGSIVGGLYASGMSPAQMDSAVLSIDWLDLFIDAPPRNDLSFRRREEDRLPYFNLEMGFSEHGLTMPEGFVAGRKLMFLLRQFTQQATGIDDFDNLPIPFRAVATSLEDGSMVVIDHGPLADAMRASMAIPGAFTPSTIDGHELIDGGFHRNIPYDVVKSMGADIVIVVDVTPVSEDLTLNPTMAGVLAQTVNVSILINANESLAELEAEDILLTPDLPGIGVGNFELMAKAAKIGKDLADKNRELLGKLSLPQAEYQTWRSGVRAGFKREQYQIGDINTPIVSRIDPRRIRDRIKSVPGTPLDLEVVGKDLTRIFAIGEFEMVDYTLEPTSDPLVKDLTITTQDKRWGPNYLNFGLSLVGHLDGQANILFLLYHRLAAINRLGAEWRNQVFLGDRLGLDTEFYQPVTMNGRFFIAPRLTGEVDKRNRWLDYDVNEVVKSKQYQVRLDLGLNISNWGELRLAPYFGYYSGDVESMSLDLDQKMGGWRGRLAFDRLDNIDFPKHGWAFDVEGLLSRDWMGASSDYDKLHGRLVGAATTGRTTLFGKVEGGTSLQTSLPFNERYELGGFSRLTGLERGRLSGDESANLGVGLFVRIAQLNPQLGESIYLGLMGEAGQCWDYQDTASLEDLVLGLNGFVGAETLLGPVYVGYGLAEGGHHSFYVMLGRSF